MRIKLSNEQLNTLTKGLPFEVMLERSSDVRGLMELIGKEMPWDETGLSKLGNSTNRPSRLTFGVDASENGYICDIHPALVQHIYTLLSIKSK